MEGEGGRYKIIFANDVSRSDDRLRCHTAFGHRVDGAVGHPARRHPRRAASAGLAGDAHVATARQCRQHRRDPQR